MLTPLYINLPKASKPHQTVLLFSGHGAVGRQSQRDGNKAGILIMWFTREQMRRDAITCTASALSLRETAENLRD
jgi:hypothetical protein